MKTKVIHKQKRSYVNGSMKHLTACGIYVDASNNNATCCSWDVTCKRCLKTDSEQQAKRYRWKGN